MPLRAPEPSCSAAPTSSGFPWPCSWPAGQPTSRSGQGPLPHAPTSPGVIGEADIVVSAVGVARIVDRRRGEAGGGRHRRGHPAATETGIVGDVDYDAVVSVAGWVTPMPGGTGPMTVACLLENTLDAARLQGVLG